jgi:excisionase family DNA binding protein
MGLDIAPFRRAGLRLSLAHFEQLVMEAVHQVLPEAPAPDSRTELSEAEVAFLQQAGVDLANFAPRDLGPDSPLARTAAEYAAILAASLTVPELASRLGVDQSSVRQRLAAHRLYGIKLGKGWRIPLFELDDSGKALVPGLHLIAPHWEGAHPVEVAEWFTQPHVDLRGANDEPISPRAWLLAGGNPRTVAALATEFDSS